jgi:GNAT superfamily N-acetyltransferase
MLRLGKEGDEDKILSLVLKFFGETQYAHLSPDIVAVQGLISRFIDNLDPDSVCILWHRDNDITGILAGHIVTVPFLGRKVATECLWWVDPEDRRGEAGKQLLDAFEHWASLRGADMIQMMSLPDRVGKALSRVYRSRGYNLTEVTYTKEI